MPDPMISCVRGLVLGLVENKSDDVGGRVVVAGWFPGPRGEEECSRSEREALVGRDHADELGRGTALNAAVSHWGWGCSVKGGGIFRIA